MPSFLINKNNLTGIVKAKIPNQHKYLEELTNYIARGAVDIIHYGGLTDDNSEMVTMEWNLWNIRHTTGKVDPFEFMDALNCVYLYLSTLINIEESLGSDIRLRGVSESILILEWT